MSHRNSFFFFFFFDVCGGKQLLTKDLQQENFRIIKPNKEIKTIETI